ncbi:hypothetical protein BDV93DRAFT_567087 [Ceratobasidium sp. AG-I]|nr:hypothetical protein BDV93DRAFT_567091 [Ceratobasidium sp. AG-I]KAF8592968.1 hypothetical protein BDV93DRAFT_567087 [Ceratobasidium sp. AG-I]
MSSQQEEPVTQIPLDEQMSPARAEILIQNLPQLIAQQNELIRSLKDIDKQKHEDEMRQSLASIVLMATFMAGVAATLLDYANNLSKKHDDSFKLAESMLSLALEYNLAVVALGILVPLLRKHWGEKDACNPRMLKGYGWALFIGLIGMSVGFSSILVLQLGLKIGGTFIACFVTVLISGSVAGLRKRTRACTHA